MTQYVLLVKVTITVLMTALCAAALRHTRLQNWGTSLSWRSITLAFVMPRLLMFGALFVVLKLPPQSDVNAYFEQAHWVIEGKRAFIDFETGYGPWFALVISWAVRIWDSGSVLVLLAVLFEFAAWPLWIRVMSSFLNEREVKLSAWLYLLSPLTFLNVPMVGMNHVWLTAFLGLAMLWQKRGRDALAGVAMGASIVLVKFISLLWVPLLFWCSRKRFSWSLGFILLPAIAYGLLLAQGANLASQVVMHAHYDSSGNIPYLFGLTGVDPSSQNVRSLFNLVGMAGLACFFIACVMTERLSTPRQVFFALPFFLLIALLLSKKSFSSYLEMTLFPLAALVVLERARLSTVVWYAITMLTTSVEPSLWFRWLHQAELSQIITGKIMKPVSVPLVIVFVAIEVLMLTAYVVLAQRLWLRMSSFRYSSTSLAPPQSA